MTGAERPSVCSVRPRLRSDAIELVFRVPGALSGFGPQVHICLTAGPDHVIQVKLECFAVLLKKCTFTTLCCEIMQKDVFCTDVITFVNRF